MECVCVCACVCAQATDWADGALARHLGQTSIIGSYLDPLADKVLVACVVGALAYGGHAPLWMAALVVGRDAGLVGGMALHRWRALGWRVRGLTAAEFFQTGASVGVPLMKPLLISKARQCMLVPPTEPSLHRHTYTHTDTRAKLCIRTVLMLSGIHCACARVHAHVFVCRVCVCRRTQSCSWCSCAGA
jgi:hypothetical protein